MRRALIGHTGFVGKNLAAQTAFSHCYNSRNFREMRGRHFDEIVCAGVQAVKWWANQNPDQDWAGIAPLLDTLATVTADHFTLISTVDVFRDPTGADETAPTETGGLHPYGLHRLRVEEQVRARYPDHNVVRLPGLFGPGLKKNLIFDVLSGRDIAGFDARSTFQFYDLTRLADDLKITRDAALATAHFAVEPVSVGAVVETLTGARYTHQTGQGPLAYDIRTVNGRLWDCDGPYLETAAGSLRAIAGFGRTWPGGS